METSANYTIVGIFVICMITAIVLAVIWLSSGFTLETSKIYLVYMNESVNGLNLDSPVEFNGVHVGSVEDIKINKINPQLVELHLKIKSSTPITQGTSATLGQRGLTGMTYVALKDKSTDLSPISIQPGKKYPIIKSAPSLFMRLDSALTQLSQDFQEISKTFDEENRKTIKATLNNLRKITDTLSKNNQKFTAILENTEKASQQFSPLLRTTTRTFKTLEEQTLPATYQIIMNLQAITGSLSAVTHDIKQNPSILIRGVDRQPLGPGERR